MQLRRLTSGSLVNGTVLTVLAAFVIYLALAACTPEETKVSTLISAQSLAIPNSKPLLSEADIATYEQIFALQDDGQWKSTKPLEKKLKNDALKGHILAQRYLHKKYTSTPAELKNWLQNYSDHPQAQRIYRLAKRKGAKVAAPKTTKRRNLSGYGESFRNLRASSPNVAGSWKTALNLWKAKKYSKAYRVLTSLEKRSKSMNDWDRAAIHFWAYRTADKLKRRGAEKHLQKAAAFPRSFYGAQAIHLLGQTLDETVSLRGADDLQDILEEIETAEIRDALQRIEALAQAEQPKMAREALMHHYSRASVKDRKAFVALAQTLDLPALQLRMGVDLERKGLTLGQALYPLPNWQPKEGHQVDPALVFAIARQESGFNNKARSHAGAQGFMQLMPKTARYIAKKTKMKSQLKLSDRATNMQLGQSYLSYLANKPYIEGNMVLLAAAYNAGPGNALRWSKRSELMSDPLLFIESIPVTETRDYVMNVMTNYWMYREIMNDDDPGAKLMAKGQWPKTLSLKSLDVAELDEGLSWPLAPRS